MKVYKEEVSFGEESLFLETGKIGRQADGSVMVRYGETVVLVTVVVGSEVEEQDFLPLAVTYQEKTFAVGRIPGGFFKREGRPSEHETLVSRLIDRSIRPLFHEDFSSTTQVLCTVLAYDMKHDPALAAMIGTSAALQIAGVPWNGVIAAARVGYQEGKFVINPDLDNLKESSLDLIVAGGKEAVLMVESKAQELSEKEMIEAVMVGHKAFLPVIEAIERLALKVGKAPLSVSLPKAAQDFSTRAEAVGDKIEKAYALSVKQERVVQLKAVLEGFLETFEEEERSEAKKAFKKVEKQRMRRDILKGKKRIDGRGMDEIRTIECEVGFLPQVHGSALFTRGETQALVVTTLGTGDDEQLVDALEGVTKANFLLHYNFPPYSVGETSMRLGPGRREIGHGKLAWRALQPLLPPEFPYTIRIVAEITESNGSSSMATVCGASLSLMDTGVPLKAPVAGIAMGLVKEKDEFVVLSDILGDEDHLGDMDFKVAGTAEGITALQMDIKIHGVTQGIMETALEQARVGRLHILEKMSQVVSTERKTMRDTVPRMVKFQIPEPKIREVIGAGGKVIKEICASTGAKLDIEDDGMITISSANAQGLKDAKQWVMDIAMDPKVGGIHKGKVVKTLDFGAFVSFGIGKKDGLVHISQLDNKRVGRVNDVVKEGDEVFVKILNVEDNGRIRLSMKEVNQKTGESF